MTYTCARCGRKGHADRFVYSRHTGNRYCRGTHLKRRKREKVTA